jgi:GT2 family glycosyltransferase
LVPREKALLVMRVAAVIPNWNGAHLLRALLPTMAVQTRPFDSILVVDNGSNDESVRVAEQFGAAVHGLPSNAGFAAAVNRGVNQVSAEIVAIVNNDVELAPDWLRCAMDAFGDPTVSFVTGRRSARQNRRWWTGLLTQFAGAAQHFVAALAGSTVRPGRHRGASNSRR